MDTTPVRSGTTTDGPTTGSRVRWGAGGLAVAGVALAVYPALRPYPDSGPAWASQAWTAAHLLAIAGFVLLTAGVGAVWSSVRDTRAERTAFAALVTTGAGVGLTLPYYGAEVFGLQTIGEWSVRGGDPGLLAMADDLHYALPAVLTFAAGLLGIAAGAVLTAVALARSGRFPAWSGVPLALGFALYVPQYFGPPWLRFAHGLLVAAGCLWVWRSLRAPRPDTGPR